MRTNRLLCLLWIVVATIYTLRVIVMGVTGQDASGNTELMLTALVLAKLYEMDGSDR